MGLGRSIGPAQVVPRSSQCKRQIDHPGDSTDFVEAMATLNKDLLLGHFYFFLGNSLNLW